MKKSLSVLAILMTVCNALSAQTPAEPTEKPVPLSELVVSATRTDRSVRELPANVTVLTREQIRLSAAQTVPDLLRSIPGFTMRDYQSTFAVTPARQAPGMRGLGGTSASRTLVLVDGVPIDDPFNSWVYWARIPLELVDRIEIVRGGSAGIWGNRALGGVINILTQRPATDAVQFSVQGGGWGTGRMSGALMHKTGRLGITAAGEWFGTDGYHVIPTAARGPIDIPAGTRHEMAFTRVEYQASTDLALHFSGSWFDEDRRLATQFRRQGVDIAQVQTGAHLSTPDGSRWSVSAFGARKDGYLRTSSEAADRVTETPALDQFAMPATSAGANLQWSRAFGTTYDVTAGADVFWTEGDLSEHTRWVSNAYTRLRVNSGRQLYRGLYVQSVIAPAIGWSIVTAGRVDFWRNYDGVRYERDLVSGDVPVDSSYVPESDSRFSYQVGLRHDMTDRLSWRSNVHTAFRAPTLNELYKAAREGGNILVEANPELVAERLLGAEIGADYILGSTSVARITAFWSRLSSPIVEATVGVASGGDANIPPCGFITAGGTCRQRQNLGASRSYGVEAELEFRPGANWRLASSYGWNPTKVIDSSDQPQILGKVARGVAEHSFTTRADYTNAQLGVIAVTARYVGKRFEDDINTIELESFFLLDARVTREVGRHWEISGGVENVLGESYAISKTASGSVRTGAPRLVQAGVRARW